MKIRDRIVELRRVPASQLAPNPANWRTHSAEQADALRGLLSEVGFAGAALARVQADGRLQLIDGHLRAETAGDEPIPVLVLDVTADEAAKLLATFDPIGAMAGADAEKLAALLAEIETQSPAVQAMLDELKAENAAEALPEAGAGGDEFDATPEASGPTRTAVGDLWLLGGRHRLLVGDNTIAANVARLMDGKTVGLCFTSPPYGQQRDYGEAAKEKVQDWHALMLGTFANLPMADDGQVLVNLGLIHREGEWIPYWDGWIEWMRSQGWRRFGWYVWDQGSGLPGDWNGRLAPSHEWIFHFNREAVRAEKHAESNQARAAKKRDAVSRGLVDTGLRAKDGTTQTLSSPDKVGQTHKVPDSVLRLTRHMANDIARLNHPATFPVALPEFALKTWPSDVYDPYMGSWTTGLAAHRLGLTSYGCELEPKFADVCLRRAEAEGLIVEKLP